jgi:hypothetical protein
VKGSDVRGRGGKEELMSFLNETEEEENFSFKAFMT